MSWPRKIAPALVSRSASRSGSEVETCRCSGAIRFVRLDRLVLVADQDQGAEPFQAVAGQVAAAELGELLGQGVGDAVDQVGLPGDQDAGARASARPG